MPRLSLHCALVHLSLAVFGGQFAAGQLGADVLADRAFQGEVVFGRLHALSVHAEGRQLVIAAPEYHLAVRSDLPPGVAPRPTRLAWILPIPPAFDRVVALPGGTPVWGELRHWSLREVAQEDGVASPPFPACAATRVPELRLTGGAGPAAAAELCAWLTELGFPTIDATRTDPLVGRGYRFALAIYLPAVDGEPLPAAATLPAVAFERWSGGLGLPVQLAGQAPLELSVFSLSKSGLAPARDALDAWLGADLSAVELVAASDLPATIEAARGGPALGLSALGGHWFAGHITGRIEAGRDVGAQDGVSLAGAADLESRHDAGADRKRKVVMFGVVLVLGLGLGILYGKARQRSAPHDHRL